LPASPPLWLLFPQTVPVSRPALLPANRPGRAIPEVCLPMQVAEAVADVYSFEFNNLANLFIL
jgi:hypothetical protein